MHIYIEVMFFGVFLFEIQVKWEFSCSLKRTLYSGHVSFASMKVFFVITQIFTVCFLTFTLAQEPFNSNPLTDCRSVFASTTTTTYRYSVRVLVAYFGWFHTSVLWRKKDTTNKRSGVTTMPEAPWKQILKSSLPPSKLTQGWQVQALKYGASFLHQLRALLLK